MVPAGQVSRRTILIHIRAIETKNRKMDEISRLSPPLLGGPLALIGKVLRSEVCCVRANDAWFLGW
jgi:hypothetical protein